MMLHSKPAHTALINNINKKLSLTNWQNDSSLNPKATVLEVKPLVVPMGSFPEVNLKSAGCFSFTKLSLKSQMYV